MITLSQKSLSKILMEVKFDPKEPGPMKVIASMEDPKYYRQRAIEEIVDSGLQADQRTHLIRAIRLLLLAIFFEGSNEKGA
jgi:hypothetical protein